MLLPKLLFRYLFQNIFYFSFMFISLLYYLIIVCSIIMVKSNANTSLALWFVAHFLTIDSAFALVWIQIERIIKSNFGFCDFNLVYRKQIKPKSFFNIKQIWFL